MPASTLGIGRTAPPIADVGGAEMLLPTGAPPSTLGGMPTGSRLWEASPSHPPAGNHRARTPTPIRFLKLLMQPLATASARLASPRQWAQGVRRLPLGGHDVPRSHERTTLCNAVASCTAFSHAKCTY